MRLISIDPHTTRAPPPRTLVGLQGNGELRIPVEVTQPGSTRLSGTSQSQASTRVFSRIPWLLHLPHKGSIVTINSRLPAPPAPWCLHPRGPPAQVASCRPLLVLRSGPQGPRLLERLLEAGHHLQRSDKELREAQEKTQRVHALTRPQETHPHESATSVTSKKTVIRGVWPRNSTVLALHYSSTTILPLPAAMSVFSLKGTAPAALLMPLSVWRSRPRLTSSTAKSS